LLHRRGLLLVALAQRFQFRGLERARSLRAPLAYLRDKLVGAEAGEVFQLLPRLFDAELGVQPVEGVAAGFLRRFRDGDQALDGWLDFAAGGVGGRAEQGKPPFQYIAVVDSILAFIIIKMNTCSLFVYGL
jgi:hypothetical protein